jgi:DNA-directed RNA polymerase subunit omega
MPLDNISELRRRVPGGKYALTRAVAERARQLQSGTTPLVEVKTPNPLSVAIDEIVQGKVTFHMHDNAETSSSALQDNEEPTATEEAVVADAPTAADTGAVDAESADASGDGTA